ncbi:DUF2057 family protein [Paramixta manurensis]|uniref:UPF0319 protein PMPD1_1700 n=1 Tax=Paramixta manurensis TaxID=2740817 RepID=A0A6M8UCM1_9GAMM|nr:DUF2057 family protein [Erwiniaceae bacterium PD-1]
MKLRLVLPGLCALLVAATCHATTLKLNPDIDLLVLDGRKISGSLLKGAEGLELENGEHQFLFRVEKTFGEGNPGGAKHYVSEPLIVAFTAHAKSIAIQLPPLRNLRDGHHFNKTADFGLIDQDGHEVISKRDRLANASHSTDLEQAMIAYNRTGKIAAVPRFATLPPVSALPSTLPADFALNDAPTERLLRLWFHQVDNATRQRLISWVKALQAS